MKKKIIIICIAVTVVAGAGGIGFAVSNSKNDKEVESAANEAVSLVLATSEESTQTASIEVATEESTSAKATTNANTEKTTENQTTTTEPQTILIEDNKGTKKVNKGKDAAKVEHFDNHNYIDIETPIGTITIDKNEYREDKIGRFWTTNDIRYHSPITEIDETLCVDEDYKLFYFDRNRDRVYPEF